MGQRVRRIKTQVPESEMSRAIVDGWRELFGSAPTKQQVSLILAQNALETGHRKSMYNYNVGNITTSGKDKYAFYDDITTDEQLKPGVWKKMNLKYRAYPNLKEGVKDYLKLLSSKNYSQAWQHILRPDPVKFSKSLKGAGYYTANEKPYSDALAKLYTQFNKSDSYKPGKAPGGTITNIESLLGNFLRQVAAMDNSRKLYKKYLPRHNATIAIEAKDRTSAIEFARLLSLALDEDLCANASVHGDQKIEVECTIPGPEKECFAAIEQLASSLAEVFEDSTKKIGGVTVKTKVFTNKTSSYQPINISHVEIEHRKFLLKFV